MRGLWGVVTFAAGLAACGGEADPARVDDILALSADAARGEPVYARECASCHGDEGDGGSGPAMAGLMTSHDPEHVIEAILDGVGSMPPHDYMEDQDIADLFAFMVERFCPTERHDGGSSCD